MSQSPSPPTRPHRARRGEGDRLRVEVLDAAESLLVRKGSMEAVSMRAIATAVGVTPAAIYLHFEDKDRLFFEVCNRRFAEFGTVIVAALRDADGVLDQLAALGKAYIRYGLEHPEHYAILFGQRIEIPPDVDPTELAGVDALGALVDVVARGQAEGVLVGDDPLPAAITLWATVHGYVQLVLIKEDFVPDVDVRGAEDAVLASAVRGLLA